MILLISFPSPLYSYHFLYSATRYPLTAFLLPSIGSHHISTPPLRSCAIPMQNYSFAPLRFAIPKHCFSHQCRGPAVRRFSFPALRISAPFRIITPLRQRKADSSVRYFAISQLSNTLPGPLFASPTPYTSTLCQSITIFSLPKQVFTQLVYAYALRTILFNARTEQFLRLTVQIHRITCHCHDSSKLCFSVAEHFTSQALLVNAKTLQDLALSPLHDATTKKCFAIPLHVESVPLLSQSAP